MSKSILLVTTAVGLTLGLGPTAQAAGAGHHTREIKRPVNGQLLPNAPARPQRTKGPATSGTLKEKFVVDSWSNDQVSLSGGFAKIDKTVTLKCKTACTIVTDAIVQFSSDYAYDSFGLCPVVDGYFTNGSCMFYQDPYPLVQRTTAPVAEGTHTATFYVYTLAPAYLDNYHIDYHVYR